MLQGRFGNTSGRPYLEGRLVLTRFNNLSADISFIVDTGADKSVPMPLDAWRMGVDYSKLRETFQSTVIGGQSEDFVEAAMIVFSEPGVALYSYQIDVIVASPNSDILDIPSLLGRDVLDHWRMDYDKPRGRLAFEVIDADFTFPLSPAKT